jgi:integrase
VAGARVKTLRKHLDEYLGSRRALGFDTKRSAWLLTNFAAFMATRRRTVITCDLAFEWAKQPADAHPMWWAQKLSIVRGFARHLHVEDPRHQIPPVDLLPSQTVRSTPVLYSGEEISRLLRAARALANPFRGRTYETLLGLLAVTGMRVGEAIQLDRNDIDWTHEALVIREAKFRKSRELVLDPTVIAALRRYAKDRDRFHRKPRSASFFLSLSGTQLIYNNVHQMFVTLLRRAGIKRRRARLHDLRHSFSVQTLLRWHREGVDVDARMPRLSTYLGHVGPSSTYWYLTASPELMALVGRKVERALGVLP